VSSTAAAQLVHDLVRFGEADAQHQGVLGQGGLVEGVVDGDAADAARAVAVAEHEVQEGAAQVVEDAAEAGVRAQVHRNEHLPKLGAEPSA
jgi:methionine aminopeptidase